MYNAIFEPVELLLQALPRVIQKPEIYSLKALEFFRDECLTQAIVCETMLWHVSRDRLIFLGSQIENLIQERM
jgi:hypothetical protein